MKKLFKLIVFSIFIVTIILSFSACNSNKRNTNVKEDSVSTNDKTDKVSNGAKESNGSQDKSSSVGSSSGKDVSKESGQTKTDNIDIKDLEKSKVRIFSKEALFGATTRISINDKNIKKQAAFYQIYDKDEPITKEMEVNKVATMYPAKNAGYNVKIKLLDKNKKVILNENAILEKDK